MKSSDVVGRKIVRVEQYRATNRNTRKPAWYLDRIVLDNGTVLTVTTIETEGDYAHELTAHKKVEVNVHDE